jgi:hypothetical protein
MASPGLAFLAIALAGYALSPSESPDSGKRVESDSYTNPTRIARCITYNINKKMPDLLVRSRSGDTSDESILLILTRMESSPATFGVIRVDQSESGSHLTTWLPDRTLLSEAPTEVARKLVAGC